MTGGSPGGPGRILFPAVGAVAGLATFLGFYLLWPSARPPGALDGTPVVQALASGSAPSTAAQGPEVRVAAGDGTASVSWRAPATLRTGQAVQYTAMAVPENGTLPASQCSTAALTCAIGGLADGATYTVEVRATDAAGTVTAVGQAQVTPYPAILTSPVAALWLDADDISGAQGTPVAVWPDVSGRGENATQTRTTAQPVLATLGGRQAVRFSGSQNMMLDGTRLPSGGESSEVFAVAELDDTAAATDCFAHVVAWGSPQTGQARMVYKGCHNQLAYGETFNTYPLMRPQAAWPEGRPALVAADFTATGVTVRLDGAADYTWTNPANVTTDTVPQAAAMVGGAPWWGDSDGWTGLIGEVIVLNGQVSATTEQSVERYLLRKWGIPA